MENYTLEYFKYIEKKYGISQKQWQILYEQQGRKCAICRRGMRLVIDHNHKTNKIRGLLCYYCNGILGKIALHKIILKNIPLYLKRRGRKMN